jgi:hypothetical protein
MRTDAACLRRSPRANASEKSVHFEDEVFSIEEHEDRRRKEEIP